MATADCLAEIEKAVGRALSDTELSDLLTELQRRQRRAKAESAGDLEGAALKAADDMANDLKTQAIIEKRNAALNLKRRIEAVNFVKTQFGDKPDLGIEALLVGVNNPKQGARWSAAAQQHELAHYYLGGFIADVEKEGLWKVLVSGELDRDIARALWQKGRDTPDLGGIPDEASKIADVVAKWQEISRLDANKAGAWVGKLDGYITRQSHDIYRIRKAGYEAWKAVILPKLDPKTFAETDDIDKFLAETYEGLASGVHLKAQSAPSGFKGAGNVGKRMSQERVLHFKSADDWFDYNLKFGSGNLRESVMAGFRHSANSTGLMRALGPNAEMNLQQILDDTMRSLKGNPEALAAFRDDQNWLRNRFAQVDGSVNIPGNATAARVAGSVRAIESMAKLGMSTISSFSDIPTYASEMRYQGQSMLSGIGEAIGALFKGRGSAERRQLLSSLGVVFDSAKGQIAARFSAPDDLPGRVSRGLSFFFKMNLNEWWTDTLRAGASDAMSHRLALNKGATWDKLDPDLTRVLSLYGIDAAKWETIRASATKELDGREYITPENISDRETASQLRSYFIDRTDYAVITPDARTLSVMRRGTRPGTVEGELLRFVGQFKSFPIAFAQKALGREIYGRGASGSGLIDALRHGNGEMAGLAQLMLWTTLFGYGSMVTKDLLKGKTPRDPLKAQTWAAAFTQGGGAGIYGDFLLGETSRFGGGLLETLAGPTLGTVNDVYDLKVRLQQKAEGKPGDVLPTLFRDVVNNTPYANLFYTRTALDYLILNQIAEWLSPGYLKRHEQSTKQQTGQSFLYPPSQTIPTGGGRLLEGIR